MPAASVTLHHATPRQVRRMTPASGLVRWEKLRPVLRLILDALHIKFSASTLRLSQTKHGVHFSPGLGSALVEVNRDVLSLLRDLPERGITGWRVLAPLLDEITQRMPLEISATGIALRQVNKGFHLGGEAGEGAATIRHNADAARLVRDIPQRGMTGWRILAPVLHQFAERLPLHISTEALTLAEIPGGAHLGGPLSCVPSIVSITVDPVEVPDDAAYTITVVATGTGLTYRFELRYGAEEFALLQESASASYAGIAEFDYAGEDWTHFDVRVTVFNACGTAEGFIEVGQDY